MNAPQIPVDPDAAEHRRVLAEALDGWVDPNPAPTANRTRVNPRRAAEAARRRAALALLRGALGDPEWGEDFTAVARAASGLPVDLTRAEREMVTLLVALGVADAETAATGLGCSRNAVEQSVSRLRRRLRERLAAAGVILPSRSADPSMSQIARNPSTSRRTAA